MQVAVAGLGDLDALIKDAEQQASNPGAALRQFVAVYLEALRAIVPVRSGRLRDSIAATFTADGALVEAGVPYALFLISGVQPQYMTWLVGHTVAFTGRDGARVVRRVTRVGVWDGRRHWYHPGTPPNDIFRKALEEPRVQSALATLSSQGIAVHVGYTYRAAA